ncbi:UNVERIFIED_CONTAM: hypothetical protein Sangu_1567200 [Sesamum angustifolium]|uniref:Retrotransposon gag domain-containing protein n=1 Tax=Sesamum angustifolium TaxID=2727405 RepID=A0AAW2MR34_9LAMI
MLYEIQREIASQGDMSISGYYNKLKKLWNELAHFTTLPQCSGGSSKAIAELNDLSQLMQFLMGLGDSYDHVRSLLLMDPLPSTGKAYSLILSVEKQREVQVGFQNDGAMAATFQGRQGISGNGPRKLPFTNKHYFLAITVRGVDILENRALN